MRLSDDVRALVAQAAGWPDMTKIVTKATNAGADVRATFRSGGTVSIAEWQRLAARVAREAV